MQTFDPLMVLVTRYNMVTPLVDRIRGLREYEGMRKWMAHRFPIFQNVCLASVLGQHVRPDLWVIGFDLRYRELAQPIIDILAPYDWIVPVWQGETEGVNETLAHPIIGACRDRTHVATTRLDNDDALSRVFLKCVRDKLSGLHHRTAESAVDRGCWVSMKKGLVAEDERYYPRNHASNAYLTRMVSVDDFRSNPSQAMVLAMSHDRVEREVGDRFFCFSTPHPMWLQVNHQQNLSARRDNYLKDIRRWPAAHFQVDEIFSVRHECVDRLTSRRMGG